jgi:hypothetical protein
MLKDFSTRNPLPQKQKEQVLAVLPVVPVVVLVQYRCTTVRTFTGIDIISITEARIQKSKIA